MTLDHVPDKLIAGDTWSWQREYSDYPSSTWAATVYFENAAGTFLQAATPAGAGYLFTIAASETASKRAGRYKWSVRVTYLGQAYTVEEGWVEVVTNPAAAGMHDPRSDARKMLDAVNATLLGRATTDQLQMQLNGRSIQRIPLPELRQFRDQLRQEVKTEERGDRAGLGRNIKTRFLR